VDIVEGGERPGLLQVGLDVTVLLVDAPEDLESKGMVLHVLTEVVIHPLHPTARVAARSVGAVAAPEVVAATTTMAACSCYDADSTTTSRS
jgi:hypothetical protein